MGKRGPQPVPTNILDARGSWLAPARRKAGEPTMEPSTPSPPSWLKGAGLKEWKRITPRLEKLGVLCDTDRNVLARYCRAWSDYLIFLAALDRQADTLDMCTPAQLSKLVRARDILEKQLHSFEDRLGLSPSSRARVRTDPKPTGGKSKAEEYF